MTNMKELAKRATRGEWVQGNAGNGQITVHDMTYLNRHIAYMPLDAMPEGEQEANAQFIAASRTWVPAAIKVMEKMAEALEKGIELLEPFEESGFLGTEALNKHRESLAAYKELLNGS